MKVAKTASIIEHHGATVAKEVEYMLNEKEARKALCLLKDTKKLYMDEFKTLFNAINDNETVLQEMLDDIELMGNLNLHKYIYMINNINKNYAMKLVEILYNINKFFILFINTECISNDRRDMFDSFKVILKF